VTRWWQELPDCHAFRVSYSKAKLKIGIITVETLVPAVEVTTPVSTAV